MDEKGPEELIKELSKRIKEALDENKEGDKTEDEQG